MDNASSSSSSSGAPAAKAPGQQHQICISQSQSTSSVVNKTAASTVVSVASLMTTATPVTGKAAVSGIKLPSCLCYSRLDPRCEFCRCHRCKWKKIVTCLCEGVKVKSCFLRHVLLAYFLAYNLASYHINSLTVSVTNSSVTYPLVLERDFSFPARFSLKDALCLFKSTVCHRVLKPSRRQQYYRPDSFVRVKLH